MESRQARTAGLALPLMTSLLACAGTSGLLVVGQAAIDRASSGITRSIVVSGGRIEVNGGRLFLTGSMVIRQNGAVVFDAGELTWTAAHTRGRRRYERRPEQRVALFRWRPTIW
jgi:hypothetical protein